METEKDESERRRALMRGTEYGNAVAEVERRERQIAALYELWRSVPHTDMGRLLQRIAERAVAALDAHTCSLMLRDRNGDTLRMAASVGLPQDVADSVTLLVGERIAGRVAATGQPILLNKDPNTHPLIGGEDGAQTVKPRDEVESSLCSPLVGADGTIHGVLCLSRLRPAAPFNEADLRVFSLFAAQAGAVVSQRRTVEDLTRKAEETARMEREMARTANLAALGQFSATVAHELRNPLSSIKGAAQYLLREFGGASGASTSGEEQAAILHDFLTIVVEEVDGLGRMTSDLLEFSRPNPTRRERYDLTEMVRSEVAFIIPELASIGVERVHQNYEVDQPAWALVDTKQLTQALRNLVLNAAHAAVSANENGGSEIRIGLGAHGGFFEISVEDNGNGVPEEVGKRLWEPFYTTKTKGSGLGLAQVRRVVEAHDGRVGFDNIPGSGARFYILLPESEAPEPGDMETGDGAETDTENWATVV
ncbi:MAG: hypothetical protein OHK0029_00140 [Armatimonadaceae bacterium]